jgi:hypothetical protein
MNSNSRPAPDEQPPTHFTEVFSSASIVNFALIVFNEAGATCPVFPHVSERRKIMARVRRQGMFASHPAGNRVITRVAPALAPMTIL